MTIPNLYEFATKELAQDATIAYILAWADPTYRESHPHFHALGTKLLRSLLWTQEVGLPLIETLHIKTQVNHIDILVEINIDKNANRIILLIEDKVSTTEHSNQIERYTETVEKRYRGSYDHLVAVYLKTGNVSKEELPPKDKCGHFLRRDLLDVLNRFQDTQNTIVDDFRTHLQRREDRAMRNSDPKNDDVAHFIQKIADWATDGLSYDIKPDRESPSVFVHRQQGHRSYRLWYSRSPWEKWEPWALSYEIGINPSGDTESCTDAFVAIKYHIPYLDRRLGDDADTLISILDNLDIREDKLHDREESRIRVDFGENELNDDFAKSLADTLRRFIEVVTPAVDTFMNERDEEDA